MSDVTSHLPKHVANQLVLLGFNLFRLCETDRSVLLRTACRTGKLYIIPRLPDVIMTTTVAVYLPDKMASWLVIPAIDYPRNGTSIACDPTRPTPAGKTDWRRYLNRWDLL